MNHQAPAVWRDCQLGDFIELKRGYDLPKRSRVDGTVPIVSSSGPSGWHNEVKVRAPGVVTGRYGTIGKVFYIEHDFWPLNTALYVRDFKGNDPRFVAYFLQSIDFNKYTDKAAVPGVNRNHLHLEHIKVPPIDQQRRIAAILGALDDKIEVNRRMNRTLEEMAQAIFKSWFIDFDGHEDMVDSELGPIPRGWEVLPIARIIEVIGGGTPKRKESSYWGGEVPWYSVRDAPSPSDIFVVATEETITQEGLVNSSARLVPEWTTIISARGTVGKLAVTSRSMAFNQSCYGVRASKGHGEIFVYFLLRSVVSHLQKSAHGSVFDTITRKTFDTALVVAPQVAKARAFADQVSPLLERIRLNGEESRTLADLRDTLLPKLISGELRVPEAEALVEAV